MYRQKKIISKIFTLLIITTLTIVLIVFTSFDATNAVSKNVRKQDSINVEIRNDGTTLLNEKPFFPFGFYHVSLGSAAGKERKTLSDIAAAGFNILHTSVNSINEYEKLLEEARKLGIYIFVDTIHPQLKRIDIVKKFKNKSAVFGWSIQDDANINSNWGCDKILKLHREIKGIDSKRVTYISSPVQGKYEKLNYCSDIIAAQAYPVPSGRPGDTYYIVKSAKDAAAKLNHSAYANVQAFAWSGKRKPTFEEVRNMTYQALLAGAKGIIYYTYRDGGWDLPQNPELWQGLKSLVPEIRKLTPIVLDGSFKQLDTGLNNILGGVWTYKNQEFVVLLNVSSQKTANVSISLPSNKVGQSTPMFASRPSRLTVKNDRISGAIMPLEVHVYSVRT